MREAAAAADAAADGVANKDAAGDGGVAAKEIVGAGEEVADAVVEAERAAAARFWSAVTGGTEDARWGQQLMRGTQRLAQTD